MLKLTKCWFAAVILAGVVCAAGDGKCFGLVWQSTVEGLFAGLGFGLVAVFCVIEKARQRQTMTAHRLVMMLVHHAQVGLVSGLLVGVTYALVEWLSR